MLPYIGNPKSEETEANQETSKEFKIKRPEVLDHFPCFLCGDLKEIRIDKNNHPYFICDPCGIQAFIRGKRGISRLELFKKNPEFQKLIFGDNYLKTSELLRIQEQIEFIEDELKKLDKFIKSDLDCERETRLRHKLKSLKSEYFKLIENN